MLSKIENEEVETYLQNLSATDASDYSPWKATKSIYRQTLFSSVIRTKEESWSKPDLGRANESLCEVFKPFPREVAENDERFSKKNCLNENAQFSLRQINQSRNPKIVHV